MMSAQSNSPNTPMMQTNTPSPSRSLSPAKTKMSLTMLSGYILAALFLIGVVVLIVLYVKKPCSGSDPSPDPGSGCSCSNCTIEITDSDGTTTQTESCGSDSSYKCTECDCAKTCVTKDSSDTPTGLEWNDNANTCGLASEWSDIDCPKDCKLTDLCPLGTAGQYQAETSYDPRPSNYQCGAKESLFGTDTDTVTKWCQKAGWEAHFTKTTDGKHNKWYCTQTYYGCKDKKCQIVDPSTFTGTKYYQDKTCAGNTCKPPNTCSFNDKSKKLSSNVQAKSGQNVYGVWTTGSDALCLAEKYYRLVDNNKAYCADNTFCSELTNKSDCEKGPPYEPIKQNMCQWNP